MRLNFLHRHLWLRCNNFLPSQRVKLTVSLLLMGVAGFVLRPAIAQHSVNQYSAMCKLYLGSKTYIETCNIIEKRDGQWRRGLRVIAPIRGYEFRKGSYSGCPKDKPTWDSVTGSCYSFSWRGEALPGNEGAKCKSDQYGIQPCGLMTTDQQLIRITPHLAVQGLTFG